MIQPRTFAAHLTARSSHATRLCGLLTSKLSACCSTQATRADGPAINKLHPMLDAEPTWLGPAANALRNAEALFIHAGAGMGVDSGLPDFRGPEGFWRAYPPMKHLGLNFQDCSNPQSFKSNPAFGWGFFGHRYQLYDAAQPHEGYTLLKAWCEAAPSGYFVFTSNVDGHFLKAGFQEERVMECHGSIHYLQPFDPNNQRFIWPAAETLHSLKVNPSTFLAEGPLPQCPQAAGNAAHTLARPNILMFNDYGWDGTRTEQQELRLEAFQASLARHSRVVIIEIGAGTGVPTVRRTSERLLRAFPEAVLLRINPSEPEGPAGRTVSIPAGGKAALMQLDAAIGGAAGIGKGVAP